MPLDIFSQDSTSSDSEDGGVPSYMISANNHNIGNLNPQLVDPEGYAAQYGNVASRAGKFIAVSAMSAVNSFYNTAVWAGNWFSDKDAQYRDTRDWISSFDNNLGDYYQDNRQAADLVGFVASSFVPGLGGVKVFNAGAKALMAAKEGSAGLNMARGLGILPGSREALVKAAVSSYDTSRQVFSYANPATLKAVAAGFGEQALQAAAFETAVSVTMKKNPILNDLDTSDIVSNIAHGALLGGAIGGAIEGAITISKVKSGIAATDKKLIGVTQDMEAVAGTKASDRLLIRRNDLDTLARNAPEGVDPNLWATQWELKIGRIDNKSREDFTELVGGSHRAELGNLLYTSMSTDASGTYAAKLLGLEEIGTHADTARLVKKYKIGEEDSTNEIRHLKLWGDDMGKLSEDAPAALHLADMTKNGVQVSARKVVAGDSTFTVNPGEVWSTAKTTYKEALARNIWAMDDTVPPLMLPKGAAFLKIGADDVPMLTKAYREGFKDFRLIAEDGSEMSAPSDLLGYLKKIKNDGATNELEKALAAGKEMPAEHFANKWDTPLGFFTGEQYSTNTEEAIFGLAKARRDYYNKFHANTVEPPPLASVKPWLKQQNYKMVYDTARMGGVDNFQVEAMSLIRTRQKLQQAANDAAGAAALGEDYALLGEFTDPMLNRVNRSGAGAGFVSFANANYGSAGSLAQSVGALVTKWVSAARNKVGDAFQSANYAVLNSSADTARLVAILQKTRSAGSDNVYVLNEAGDSLILRSVRDYQATLAEGAEDAVAPIIPNGVDESIELGSPAVADWVETHIALNGERSDKLNSLRGAKGQPDTLDPEAFYPPAPNPDRFKFHAIVTDDEKIGASGHTTMLYATSAQDLEKQMAAARAAGFNAFTPNQTAQYYKARGLYDYTKGFNENQMDKALRMSGASSPAFPLTGSPQEILQDLMEWHAKEEAIVIREAVSTKYSRQFGALRQMGEEHASVAQAKMGWKAKFSGEAANPYEDYIKTFLGASLKGDYPLWTALNNFVDEAGSKVYQAVSKVVNSGDVSVREMIYPKKIGAGQFDYEEVNRIFDKYGIRMAATEPQLEAWVNHPAGTTAVSKFIQQQNAVLSALTLRLDPVNALNNALGSTILTGAETASLLRAVRQGSEEAAGELAGLAQIAVPGVQDLITSPAKLIARAYKAFFQDDGTLLASYKNRGFVSDLSTQYKELIEHATIKGTETAAELESKYAKMVAGLKQLADKGEKWTGNKLAEEMNRFVSANVMDQITSVAVNHGLIDAKSAESYINTFVNRTQGNMIASQRPQMFQGSVGQAIGLFQSYQFNLMQQLMRYVGEGSKKDAMTLLGLQGTMYGMNGLPAFQAINQHIIGTASGNTAHTDAYNSVNNIVGKTAGDWLMYGVSSNMFLDPDLKLNMYSRGDINPRQITVVPTNMADVPIVSSWAKVATSLKNSLGSIANGGDVWQSILSGIEHNGISRPLAGIARVSRGFAGGVSYSTSGKGNVTSANDLMSLANLARITGAKPFDEAVTMDAMYRVQAYQALDNKKRVELGSAVKSVIASGGTPSQEQMQDFMTSYAKSGGKQEEFTKWYVGQLRSANTPQANKIIKNSQSPYASYMQSIMGGRQMNSPIDIRATQEQPQE